MIKFIPMAMLIAALGSGRLLPGLAAVVGLVGVVLGGMALARFSRAGAIVGAAMGFISLVIGGLHAANSASGFGTGNGLAGAIVAMVFGLVGMIVSGLALARSRRLQSNSHLA